MAENLNIGIRIVTSNNKMMVCCARFISGTLDRGGVDTALQVARWILGLTGGFLNTNPMCIEGKMVIWGSRCESVTVH